MLRRKRRRGIDILGRQPTVKVIGWRTHVNPNLLPNTQPVEDDLGRAIDHADGAFGVGLS